MSDKLIRDLLINVRQKGGTQVIKVVEQLTTKLEDAAAGAELTNQQLAKMPSTLKAIERSADRAGKSLANVRMNRSLASMNTTLTSFSTKLDQIAVAITSMTDRMETGFRDTGRVATNMGNAIVRATEKVGDSLVDVNTNINRVNTSLNNTSAAGNRATRALGGTSGAARGAARQFAAIAKLGGPIPGLYALIASNVYVLQQAFENLKIGDQLNRLEKFGTITGAQTGTPVQVLALSLQQATGQAISFQEAMKQASMAAAYGFSSDQLNEFGLVARRAAAVLGVDMTDALNRVIKGVSKQEIELLDELGVTIRLNEAFSKYVDTLNAANTGIKYNAQSLSSYQKQQAYANAVVAESTRRFGYLDSILKATPWETFGANANSAIRSMQTTFATYLEPMIDTFNTFINTTQAAQSIAAAGSQKLTNNIMIGSGSPETQAQALQATKDSLDKAEKLEKDSIKRREVVMKEYNERMKGLNWYSRQLVEGLQGADGAGGFLAKNLGSNKYLEETAALGNQWKRLNQEIDEGKESVTTWSAEYNRVTSEIIKTNPQLAKSLNLAMPEGWEAGGIAASNQKAIEGYAEQAKALKQVQATSGDISNDMANVGSNTNTAAKASAALNSTLLLVKSLSLGVATDADRIAKSLNIGVSSLDQLEKAARVYKDYSTVAAKEKENELNVQKEIAAVYAKTGSKSKAEEAGRALEAKQLEENITALKGILEIDKQNVGIQQTLYALETKKLKVKNEGMKADEKVKDRSDKIIGVEQRMALLRNRTMTDQQYTIAQIQTELAIEKEKYAWYSKQAKKHVEAEQSRQKAVQLERDLWKERQNMQDVTTQAQEAALSRGQTSLDSVGQSANLQEQLDFYNKRKAEVRGNAQAQAELNLKIQDTIAAQNQLAIQRNKQMQASVGSSVGAVYTPTTGLMGDDKATADMQNKLASYDQAIAKMSELNSEATAVGQSLGNLTNSVMQFSQGSLDMTSMVAAGMQSVSTMIQFSTSNQISAIDAAISAEQKRDGKSEESKAKIKKLEAEKVKIQQAAAKKQIIIQTAVAVMQAATSIPYPWSIPLMVAAGLAGALSLSQASNASSMSSVDSGAGTTASLSLGERQKNVDVSMSANRGELSYVRGEKGVGNASTFIPRAEGGNIYPGVNYAFGENGMEVGTPMVPMKVTPAEEVASGNSGSSAGGINLYVSTMDAASFRDFALGNSGALRDAVEYALNENGASLRRLSQ
ncbi:tail length tape measure protein [Pectobacterium phage My1]|uniref:Putative pore-forming tail tip protein n=1 Tax=Pectobacterium phage My1 TaxID=1204539 RepID=J9QNZ0_9CAUD|nr:tail length tape measure protein [Pectobacterium phage My1]AFQ22292.1 putative pore-forming tail tip protein [Pectobacterium phage My1]